MKRKLKELVKLPEERNHTLIDGVTKDGLGPHRFRSGDYEAIKDFVKQDGSIVPFCTGITHCSKCKEDMIYNQALQDVGEIEVPVMDEKEVFKVVSNPDLISSKQIAKAICSNFPLPQRMELDEKEFKQAIHFLLNNLPDNELGKDAAIHGTYRRLIRFAKPDHSVDVNKMVTKPVKEELDEKTFRAWLKSHNCPDYYIDHLAPEFIVKFAVPTKPDGQK